MREGKRRNVEKPIEGISNKELIDHAYFELNIFERFGRATSTELLKRFEKIVNRIGIKR